MKEETYHFEVRTLLAQFADAFNDIVIRRYDHERNVEDKIHCGFVYAPKTRTLHDLENKAKHIKIPIISVSVSGITRNVNRVFNKLDGPYFDPDLSNGFAEPLQPVPVDINVSMSIITRFQSDIDQILTNFMPYTDPYVVVSWRDPHTEHEIRSTIKWDGNVSFEYPVNIAPNAQYRIIANTSFVIEGWVFKHVEKHSGKIYKIDLTYTAVSDLNKRYEALVAEQSDINTDYFTISGRGQVFNVQPYQVIPCEEHNMALYGNMFESLCSLYVSGSDGVYDNMTWQNPASGNFRISAMYPGFSGVEIDNWLTYGDNRLSFVLPPPLSAGNIDVIVFTEAGYGLLTEDSVRPTLNPYVSGTEEYENYVEYQPPCISGIEVLSFYDNCN